MVATAGASADIKPTDRVFVSDYLPGDLACQRADLVICNGGSPTTHQALAAGKPVIGVPANLDQHLNMMEVTREGAGVTVLTEHCHGKRLGDAMRTALGDAELKRNAERLAAEFKKYDSSALFGRFVGEAIAARRSAATLSESR